MFDYFNDLNSNIFYILALSFMLYYFTYFNYLNSMGYAVTYIHRVLRHKIY